MAASCNERVLDYPFATPDDIFDDPGGADGNMSEESETALGNARPSNHLASELRKRCNIPLFLVFDTGACAVVLVVLDEAASLVPPEARFLCLAIMFNLFC